MNIKCTDKKTFELVEGSQQLGHLTYKSLFSFKAQVQVGDDKYDISPKGLFGTEISVTQNNTEVALMKMTFHGGIVIAFQDGKEFILKSVGTFNVKYILEDENQQQILVLHP